MTASDPERHPAPPVLLLPTFLLLVTLLAPTPLAAQSAGGMLFSYQPHPGERESFDEGYRSHLEWHREKADSLPWYGWDVIAGRRLGQFVDGTFGVSFRALDVRVDPAGDAAHARSSFLPHARATNRWAVRLRPELGTAAPLEEGEAPPLAQVVTYTLPPGAQADFAEVLRGVRERARARELLPYTVYESVVGTEEVQLTLMIWRRGLAGFDRPEADPAEAVRRALSEEAGAAILATIRAESELWRLRPTLTLVPASGGPTSWRAVRPGGETRCGHGDPFEFWIREGQPDELLLFLQGGGACWDWATCHPDAELRFDPAVTPADRAQRRHGIFDASHPGNPFAGATAVFVPYCTGDFHLGTRSVTYEPPPESELGPVTVRHRGWTNLTAVLDHLSARGEPPARITVVGASAGAVASPVMAARMARRFPGARVRQIGDGAAGLRFSTARELMTGWGADAALSGLGVELSDSGDAFTALYVAAAELEPGIRFSQVATDEDAVVAGGLAVMGEGPESVERKIGESYDELEEAGICFSGYLLQGEVHTVVWRPELWDAEVDGEPLARRLERDVLDRPCPRSGGVPDPGVTSGR